MSSLPQRVRIVEVGPRDGLQNEPITVPTADKVRFITMLAEAGLTDIEVGAFVSPQRVPRMADTAEVLAQLPSLPFVRYITLVPNLRGLERAMAAGARAIAVFTAASDTFNQRNVGMRIADSLREFHTLIPAAKDAGLWVRGYVSTAFVCPYEGPIAPEQVVPVAQALLDMGADEISIGDTIGHATPEDVARLNRTLLPVVPLSRLAYHLHDTRGNALSNVQQALRDGIAIFDASAGGLGGCPFAPGAPGNLATESLLDLLHDLEIETGVDRARLAEATRFLTSRIGRPQHEHS
ncbi:MAG: hydroxymethylglutaryl-CoA lyase [Chloroherpetonaceae bacterium]|nr:hydroxymethylglutaryl-CoA lyase [Chloroherpetonaceae bacterium]